MLKQLLEPHLLDYGGVGGEGIAIGTFSAISHASEETCDASLRFVLEG